MDARIIKTKQKIKNTLLQLLKNKKINAVTISEICQNARINRNTFYAHYSSPEQVLDEIADELMKNEYELLNNCTTAEQTVITACEYTKANIETNLILLNNNYENVFLETGTNDSLVFPVYIVDNKNTAFTKEQIQMIQEYIVHGTTAILKKWIHSGMKETPEEIGRFVNMLSESLIVGINAKK